MIRVSVAVSTGTTRFKAEVRAESIEDAVRLAAGIYPDGEVRVLFPIDAEAYFSEDPLHWRGRSVVLPRTTEPEAASSEPSPMASTRGVRTAG